MSSVTLPKNPVLTPLTKESLQDELNELNAVFELLKAQIITGTSEDRHAYRRPEKSR